MPYFILQTALLLLAAYLVGAILGCLMRRLLTASREAEETEVLPTGSRATMVTAPVAAGEPVPQRAAPDPVQPRIETVAQHAPPPSEASKAARFERALTGAPSQAAPSAPAAATPPLAAKPAAAPATSPARPAEPLTPASAPAAVQAGAAAVATVATAAAVAAAAQQATKTIAAAATNAATETTSAAPVAAAPAETKPAAPTKPIVTVTPAVAPPTKPATPVAPAQPAAPVAAAPVATSPQPASGAAAAPRVIMPAAAGSGGVASTSAPVVTPAAPVVAKAADDLTRIRSIDTVTAAVLGRLGFSSYEHIAKLSAADVARINEAIPGGFVSREGWIEQARVLASGGSTAFARGDAGGGETQSGMWGAGPGTAVAGRPVTAESLAAAAAAAAAATATASVQMQTAASAATPSVQTPQATVSAPTAKPAIVITQPVAVQPAPVQAPAAPVAPAAAATPDDLTLIRAIDGLESTKLGGSGITRFAQIAAFTAADVDRFEGLLVAPGRISREGWIEQAQILAKGGETEYTRRRRAGSRIVAMPAEALAPAANRLPPREGAPAPMPEIQLSESKASFAPNIPNERLEPPAVRADTGIDTHVASVVAKTAATAAAAVAAGVVAAPASGVSLGVGSDGDDLGRIRGVDPSVRDILKANGVTRFAQIASWTADEVRRFDGLVGSAGRIGRENWVEQAQILAKGGFTDYEKRRAVPATQDTPSMSPAAVGTSAVADVTAAVGAAVATAVATATGGASTGSTTDAAPAEAANRPTRLADAIRVNQERSRPAVEPPRSDVGGLRSVRSELLRDKAGDVGPAEDLKRIRGIGVLIEKKLNSLGISRYEQIANWTSADIDRMSQMLDFKGRIERESWVEQARILASGGQTEFSRRIEKP